MKIKGGDNTVKEVTRFLLQYCKMPTISVILSQYGKLYKRIICFFYLCHRARRLSSVDCFSVAFPTKPCCCSLRSATSSSSCWSSPRRLVAEDRAASRGLSCSTDWQISWMQCKSGARVADPQCNQLVHLVHFIGMFQNTAAIKLLYDCLI